MNSNNSILEANLYDDKDMNLGTLELCLVRPK